MVIMVLAINSRVGQAPGVGNKSLSRMLHKKVCTVPSNMIGQDIRHDGPCILPLLQPFHLHRPC